MTNFPKECRFCDELICNERQGKEWFRCWHGRFDIGDRFSPGGMISRYFAWSGIWRPNKTVAAAQKNCPYFELHSQVLIVSKTGSGDKDKGGGKEGRSPSNKHQCA